MPEGPSIIILKELLADFDGKKIISTGGNAKENIHMLEGKTVHFKTWGKHLLICTKNITLRIHLMMFGTYRINEEKASGLKPKVSLFFKNGYVHFYTVQVKLTEQDADEIYDWSADIMSNHWSGVKAKKKLKEHAGTNVCDVLLDQQIFSGSGNIIKNEVLFRTKIHPKSTVGALPAKQLNALVKATSHYSFDFLKWKKAGTLKKNWEIYTKKKCPRCGIAAKKEYLGKSKRRTFFCDNCQKLYQ